MAKAKPRTAPKATTKPKTAKPAPSRGKSARAAAAKTAPPRYDPAKGKAAFEALLPRLRKLPASGLANISTDIAAASMHALATALRVNAKPLLARFEALPKGEFDIAHVLQLEQLAWAALHAAREAARFRDTSSEAKLPADLVTDAYAVEARMQRVCEHLLDDHPQAGAEVVRLRPGTSYTDLATDLAGYAKLYLDYEAIVRGDPKFYVDTDRDDAVALSDRISVLLGDAMTPEARTANDLMARAFTLLVTSYAEVAAAGSWLCRHEPALLPLFVSLYTAGRSSESRSRKSKTPRSKPTKP